MYICLYIHIYIHMYIYSSITTPLLVSPPRSAEARGAVEGSSRIASSRKRSCFGLQG